MRKGCLYGVMIIFCGFNSEAAFNNTASGARSLALGRASTALVNEIETASVNPAGLSKLKTGLSFSHANLYSLSRTNLDSFAMTQPNTFFPGGVFGLFYLKEDAVEQIKNKFAKSDRQETTISFCLGKEVILKNGDYPFSLSLGSALKLFKAERMEVRNDIDRGAGLDLGILCQPKEAPYLKDVRIGLAIKNLLTTRVGQITPQKSFRLGLSTLLAKQKKIKVINIDNILLVLDMDKHEDESFKLQVGLETVINKNLIVRFGRDDKNLTAGLGYCFGQWGIDYGLGLYDTGKTHYLTISLKY